MEIQDVTAPGLHNQRPDLPWLQVADLARALTVYLGLGYEVAGAADGWVLISSGRITFVLARDHRSARPVSPTPMSPPSIHGHPADRGLPTRSPV